MTNKTSFGEYFDNQRDKIVKDMQDKNKQQNVEWMERYEERQKEKRFRNHIIENLKEGVDYLDDIQRNKENPSPLLHLTPGTEEYKKVEAELIKQICEIDLGDESRFDIV